MRKALIIRFSSFGDILQCLSAVDPLRKSYDEVYWLTKSNFADLVRSHHGIKRVIAFDKKKGLWGLLQLLWSLRKENFDFIYDAHCNPRSFVAKLILLGWKWPWTSRLAVRSKQRWKRFLLFNFGWNFYDRPFKARVSFLKPLGEQNQIKRIDLAFPDEVIEKVSKLIGSLERKIMLIPGAAWPLKQWPAEHWQTLVQRLEWPVIILGGPAEEEQAAEILLHAKEGSLNLAGQLSLLESSYAISISDFFVSNDTGLLHVGDLMEKNGVALIGPTAFGYPSSETVRVFEREMYCRPCSKDGRGKCYREIDKQCLVDIRPLQVLDQINTLLK